MWQTYCKTIKSLFTCQKSALWSSKLTGYICSKSVKQFLNKCNLKQHVYVSYKYNSEMLNNVPKQNRNLKDAVKGYTLNPRFLYIYGVKTIFIHTLL